MRSDVLRIARPWISTPYVPGAACRGAGCDCVGFVRGVIAELTGRPLIPAPPWRDDWFNDRARPLIATADANLARKPPSDMVPGDFLILRVRGGREAHCGILEVDGQFLHAIEGVGVCRVPFGAYRPSVAYVAAFPFPE